MCDLIDKVLTSKDYSNSASLILIYLIKKCAETGSVTVSSKRVASDLKMNSSTVNKNLKMLRYQGLIEAHANVAEDGGTLANTYTINADKL